MGDLISQLQPTDGVNVPATPGFGVGTSTPVMQGPMTPADLDRTVQVKNIMFLALKRIEKELAHIKAKNVKKEHMIKDLSDKKTWKLKAIQSNQAQMSGAIQSSNANVKKTEYMLE